MQKLFYAIILGAFCGIITSCSTHTETANSVPPEARNTVLAAVEEGSPPENQLASYVSGKKYKRKDTIAERFGPKPQQFEYCDADSIIEITCKGGTVVRFDAGVFVYAGTQKVVHGFIDVQVTEYLSDADIILAGLNTTSKGKLIETAGMIYIAASAEGQPLELKSGELYSVSIPALKEQEGMELFYGTKDGDQFEWTDAKTEYTQSMYGRRGVYEFVSEQRPFTFTGGTAAMYRYLHDNTTLPESDSLQRLKATCYVNFTLDFRGHVSDVFTSPHIRTYADTTIAGAFRRMPDWYAGTSCMSGFKKKMMLPISIDLVRKPKPETLKETMRKEPPYAIFKGRFNGEQYVMASSQLGWLNCDRFVNNEQPLVDLFIEVDSTDDASVLLVMRDMRGILSGERFSKGYLFHNVPANSQVDVVTMRSDKDDVQLSINIIQGNKGWHKPEQFTTYTKEKLVKRLEILRSPEIQEAPATAMN